MKRYINILSILLIVNSSLFCSYAGGGATSQENSAIQDEIRQISMNYFRELRNQYTPNEDEKVRWKAKLEDLQVADLVKLLRYGKNDAALEIIVDILNDINLKPNEIQELSEDLLQTLYLFKNEKVQHLIIDLLLQDINLNEQQNKFLMRCLMVSELEDFFDPRYIDLLNKLPLHELSILFSLYNSIHNNEPSNSPFGQLRNAAREKMHDRIAGLNHTELIDLLADARNPEVIRYLVNILQNTDLTAEENDKLLTFLNSITINDRFGHEYNDLFKKFTNQ